MIRKNLDQFRKGEPCFVKRINDTQYEYGIFNRIEKDNPKGIVRCLMGNYSTILPYFENFKELREAELINRGKSRFRVTPHFLIEPKEVFGFYVGDAYKDIFEEEMKEAWKFYLGKEFKLTNSFIPSEYLPSQAFGHLKGNEDSEFAFLTAEEYESCKDLFVFDCYSSTRKMPSEAVFSLFEDSKVIVLNNDTKDDYKWEEVTIDYYDPSNCVFFLKELSSNGIPRRHPRVLPIEKYKHLDGVKVPSDYRKNDIEAFFKESGIDTSDFIGEKSRKRSNRNYQRSCN